MESGWTKNSSVEVVTRFFTFSKLHKSDDTSFQSPEKQLMPLTIDNWQPGPWCWVVTAHCSVFTLQLCRSGAVSFCPSLRSLRSQCFYKFNFPILHTPQIFCYPATASTSAARLWRLHVISSRIWKSEKYIKYPEYIPASKLITSDSQSSLSWHLSYD